MNFRLTLGAVFCLVAASVCAEPVTTIRNNGNPMNRLDVAVLGDGYTAAEIAGGKYALDVEKAINGLFGENPFFEYRAYFNVHRIDVTSAESGADHPSVGIFHNTALNAAYDCAGIQRLICVNSSLVNAVLTRSIASPAAREVVLIIVNDVQYGGSGGAFAVASINSQSIDVVKHELGHSLGLLADEYGGPPPPYCVNTVEPSAANATTATIRSQIKWNSWIGPATPIPTTAAINGVPGLFQGAAYCDVGLYRPTFNSKMRSLNVPFYQINTEQLIKRFHNFVSPIDDAAPSSSSVVVQVGSFQRFTVTPLQPVSHALSISWRLDGRVVGSGTEYLVDSSAGRGVHTLDLVVSDPTPLVRTDTAGVLRATRTWKVIVGGASGDFDGDGKADISVFRPSNGAWYIRGATVATNFGGAGDIPVGRDYDGDGKTDIAVFRPATSLWFIWQSKTQTGISYTWGGAGDIPVPADYDGDGKADIAVFRPATGVWFIWQSSTQTGITYTWGGGADIPVPRDYDGDGKTDIAVFRPATGVWLIWQSATSTGITYTWGGGGDIPVPNDYDGDGKTDIAVFRPGNSVWYIWQSATQTGITYTWGGSADIPVPGDYDGDGKTDIAVFRPLTGVWYVWLSGTSTGFSTTWGGGGDVPILKRP